MSSFSLLWSSILNSSLWVRENKETRLVWITLLAMKDVNGVIRASLVGLADRAKVTVEECQEALERLMSPDPYDTSGVEEGRRIRKIEGGWEVINNDKYRFSSEAKREMWRLAKARHRALRGAAKQKHEAKAAKGPRGAKTAAERAYEAALKSGDPEAIRKAEANGVESEEEMLRRFEQEGEE